MKVGFALQEIDECWSLFQFSWSLIVNPSLFLQCFEETTHETFIWRKASIFDELIFILVPSKFCAFNHFLLLIESRGKRCRDTPASFTRVVTTNNTQISRHFTQIVNKLSLHNKHQVILQWFLTFHSFV